MSERKETRGNSPSFGVHMDSPSAERNKSHIWKVLSTIFQKLENNEKLQVIEIAAGAGVHTIFFVESLLNSNHCPAELRWIPSDPDLDSLSSIYTRVKSHNNEKVQSSIMLPPKKLTLNKNGFIEDDKSLKLGETDVMVCINMIHISPWEATLGLMMEASKQLKSKTGYLYCYGPYLENGSGALSNVQFDRSLKSRDSDWGVRNVEDVVEVARKNGLILEQKIDMPRENTSLIFRKF